METKDLIKQKRIEKQLTMKQLAEKVGVSEATISRWESGNIATMKQTKIALLAKALDISPTILVTGSIHPTEPILKPRDEKDIAKRLEQMMSDLSEKQAALMFDGEPLDDEDVELLKVSLENTLRLAKMRAKQKYTPNKYKK